MRALWSLLFAPALIACNGSTPAPVQPPPSAAPSGALAPPGTTASGASPVPGPAAEPAARAGKGEACGPLGCRAFATPEEAFATIVEAKPLVLGIGEAHAQKGTEQVTSSTKRFTEQLLPELKGKASFLLVELMLPNDKCKKETKQVQKQQKPVTAPQAETNQNEYVVLGQKAKAAGIVPDLLRPSCDDLTKITEAGASDIGVMLETIARLTKNVVQSELDRNKKASKDLMVVAYGGALHNDIEPRQGREAWSYGPALAAASGQRYVELDLIVPEYIKDSETWTSLPWYSHYDREKLGDKTVLFSPRAGSYVLIFPLSSAKK